MKFSCVLIREGIHSLVGAMSALMRVVPAASTPACVVLSDGGLELRLIDFKAQAFFALHVSRFAEFRIQSKANNVIAFEIHLPTLLDSLKSADKAQQAEFKLTKKRGSPLFSVVVPETINGIHVVQDCPIMKLLPVKDLARFREPVLPREPDVIMAFPDLRHVKTVLERFKEFDKFVRLAANPSNCSLTFKVDNEIVSVRAVYHNLAIIEEDQQPPSSEERGGGEEEAPRAGGDMKRPRRGYRHRRPVASSSTSSLERNLPSEEFHIALSIKELIAVTHGAQIRPSQVVLTVVKGYAVVIYLQMDDGVSSLTYYIPVFDPQGEAEQEEEREDEENHEEENDRDGDD